MKTDTKYNSKALGWFNDEPYWGVVVADSDDSFIVMEHEIKDFIRQTGDGYNKYVDIVREWHFDKYVRFKLREDSLI
jgi:hypothetical protein